MAYGLKYTLNFRDEIPGSTTLYNVNIYASGFVGSSTAITATEAVVRLDYKKQDLKSPICGSELTIGIFATVNYHQYDEFLTAAPLAYYVTIQQSTDNGVTYNNYWQGVNTTDTYTQPRNNNPFAVALKFNCGLGELQWHRYENGGALFESYETVSQIISNCFSLLPYTMNIREMINIREDTMMDTKGLLEQTYLDDAAFYEIGDDGLTHGMNCNAVLNKICTSLNLRIYQSNNMWWIERISERINTSIYYFDYSATNAIETNNTTVISYDYGYLTVTNTINNSSFPKLINGSEMAVTQKQPITVYKLDTSAFNNDQLIPNPYFEDKPTSKDSNGRPLRWDRSASIQSFGGDAIKLINPYEADARYRWAYCFGATNIIQNVNALNSRSGWYPGQVPYNSTFSMHAVLRSGDTYTRPWLYVDSANGQLTLNFQLYFNVTINPGAGIPAAGTYALNIANNLMNCVSFYPVFLIRMIDGTGTYTLNNWISPQWSSGASMLYQQFSLGDLMTGSYYPNDGLQQIPMNASYLAGLIQRNRGGSFNLKFRLAQSMTVPLTALGGGATAFDCVAYAPWYDKTATAGISGMYNTTFSLNDYGLNAVDVAYKDTYYAASPYEIFYAAADSATRWNQLEISTMLGDTLTPGYPGSFRVSGGGQTTTWHNRGMNYLFDNGTSNADPGTGKFRFNSATLSSVTHVYIDNTDNQGNSQSAFIGGFAVGKTISFGDYGSAGNLVYFTVVGVTSHTGYHDIQVTFVSSRGGFVNGDSCGVDYNSGQILADIVFTPFAQIVAIYRRNIKGKIIGNNIQYWQTIVENDNGTLRNYMQLGHTFDLKQGTYTTDMEEMSSTGVAITPTRGTGTVGVGIPTPILTHLHPPVPIYVVTTTPVSKGNPVKALANISYPTTK